MTAGAATAQPERPDVFVSYSRADLPFVRRLVVGLEAAGKDVWVDWEDIPKTAEWRARIENGVEAATTVVVVLSPDFADSAVCAEEVDHAVRNQKRLAPIVRREVDPARLREEIAARNWIFFREADDFDRALAELVETLETDLEWVTAHARLLVRAAEWDRAGRDASFLLRGTDLAAAEEWLAQQGAHRESATPLQVEYVLAGRRAATRRGRAVLAGVVTALAVSIGLGVLALLQRNAAIDNEHQARSRELAARSAAVLDTDPELSVLLAVEAARQQRTPAAEDALRTALARDFLEHTLRGHDFDVDGARFVGNRRVLTAGGDSARLWDAATGRLLRVFRSPRDLLTDAAASPDLRTVATVSTTAETRLWNVATGEHRVLGGEDNWHVTSAVEFSPDGRLVATASGDTTWLWDVRTGAARHVLRPAGGDTVAFSPDGRIVATDAWAGGGARLWSARTGRPLHVLPIAKKSGIGRIVFSPDGRLVVAALGPGSAHIWNVGTGRTLEVLGSETRSAGDVAFGPAGTRLAAAIGDTATVWRIAGGRRMIDLRGHSSGLTSVAFSPDSRFLLTGSGDATARVWDLSTGRTVAQLLGHTGGITVARFSPDGRRIVTAGSDATARVWRAPGMERTHTFPGGYARLSASARFLLTRRLRMLFVHDRAGGRPARLRSPHVIYGAEISPDGRYVLAVLHSLSGALLWDTRTGRRRTFESPATYSTGRFSPDGRMIVLGADDGSARLIRVGEARAFRVVRHPPVPPADELHPNPDNTIVNAAFSPAGDRVVTASADKTARVWDVATGRLVSVFRGHDDVVWDAAFSPDGTLVASTQGITGGARVWDARTGRPVLRLPHVTAEAAPQFSPDGTRMLTIEDKTVRVHELSGRTILETRQPTFRIVSATFNREGTRIIVGDGSGVRILDAVRGSEIESFPGSGDPRAAIDAGDRFVFASGEGSTVLYACELCRTLDELLATVARRVDRTLTADERRTYLGR